MTLRINQHNSIYFWENSEENSRATNTHNCKARGNKGNFYRFDLGLRELRHEPDVEACQIHNHINQIEVMCARQPASPRWRPNPEMTLASRSIPVKDIRNIRKTTRLGCVFLRRNANNNSNNNDELHLSVNGSFQVIW